MKKQIKKTKIKKAIKQKKKQQNCPCQNNCFKLILLIVLTPILILVLVFLFKANQIQEKPSLKNNSKVSILTDKNIYLDGEEIELTVKNDGTQSVYFEPCEYLNVFEKKVDGEWEKEDAIINSSSDYNQVSFNKNKSITKCEIELPKSGEGIYRSVVQIYYNCIKPGYCERDETFYSNEFEIKKRIKNNE